MGWLFYEKPKNVKAHMDGLFTFTHQDTGACVRVLDSAIVHLHEYYAAVESISDSEPRTVTAVICLLEYRLKDPDGFTFGYKDMDEAMGPNAIRCPERILKLLTMPENDWAKNWRVRCQAYRIACRSADLMPEGTRVRMAHNDREYTKVKHAKRKHVFRDVETGQLYRFRQESVISATIVN